MSRQITGVDNALLSQIREAVAESRNDELPALLDAIGTSTLEDVLSGAAAGARDVARRLDKPTRGYFPRR